MNSGLTFITNEEGNKLSDRFNTLIKNTKSFDCLVGYFYKSGFHLIYKALEDTEKIRILIGISTDNIPKHNMIDRKFASKLFNKKILASIPKIIVIIVREVIASILSSILIEFIMPTIHNIVSP